MSEKIKSIEKQYSRVSPRRAVAMGLIALAGSAGAEQLVDEAAARPSARLMEKAQKYAPAPQESTQGSIKTETSTPFQRIMNANVRSTAINLARRINTGPSKPTSEFSSFVGPNQLRTVYYGNINSKNGYSVSTLAPVQENGQPNLKKLLFVELQAGRNTRLSISRDIVDQNWSVEATYYRKSGPYQIRAAVNPLDSQELKLGANRLDAVRTQANDIISAANRMAPVRAYPPAFQAPQLPNGVEGVAG